MNRISVATLIGTLGDTLIWAMPPSAPSKASNPSLGISLRSSNTTPQKLGYLGYWVAYRVIKSYYRHATDKR